MGIQCAGKRDGIATEMSRTSEVCGVRDRCRSRSVLGQAAFLLAFAGACSGCLDLLGYEEDVTEHSDLLGMSRLQDDRIEDKHPVFDPFLSTTETFRGGFSTCDVTLNKSASVTKMNILPFDGANAALAGKLFHNRTDALNAVGDAPRNDVIPSMEVVNGHLKPFNDGLYAAVELHVESQKKQLLRDLLLRINALLASADASLRPPLQDAAAMLGTALILGGDTPTIDGALLSRADARAKAFTNTPKFSRPIGFYTWNETLGRIFTRDRFFQNTDEGESMGAFCAVAFVLGQDPDLRSAYQRVTALYAGLTNPYFSYTVDELIPFVSNLTALADPPAIESAFRAANPTRWPCGGPLLAFLPSSRSKEVDYFDKRFCDGVPNGTNLLDVLVGAIQSGALDLSIAPGAGWYDYQEFALETLLVPERGPESQHLLLTVGYKKKLVDTFKSILIQNRETHVKTLAVAAGKGSAEIAPVDVYPLLPAEPFPTFYLRTARGYRFLRTFLQAALGAEFLSRAGRVNETGAVSTATLGQELDRRINLLYGLHFASADAVGLYRLDGLLPEESAEIDVTETVAVARDWLTQWKTDSDVIRDPRVILPILYEEDGSTRYWAVVGVKALKVHAEFVKGFEPKVVSTTCPIGAVVPHDYTLLVEETADIHLPAGRSPPTRSELRAICDAHATTKEILQALGSI